MASKLLLVLVLTLDAIAVGLAIVAEFKRTKSWTVTDPEMNYQYCLYGLDIATGFGFAASLLLMASSVLITVDTRHLFCGKQPGGAGSSRARVVALFIACWVLLSGAEACLLVASVKNANRSKYRTMFAMTDGSVCQPLRRGVFAAGAGLAFLTAIASAFYYVCYSHYAAAANEIQPDKTDNDPDSGDVKEAQAVSSVVENRIEEGGGLNLDSSEPIQTQDKVKESPGYQ